MLKRSDDAIDIMTKFKSILNRELQPDEQWMVEKWCGRLQVEMAATIVGKKKTMNFDTIEEAADGLFNAIATELKRSMPSPWAKPADASKPAEPAKDMKASKPRGQPTLQILNSTYAVVV